MARYIDADLLRNEMEELYEHHLEMKNFCADGAVSDCLYFLDNSPTADVVEVKHGEWIEWYPPKEYIITSEEKLYCCSICDAKYEDVEGYKYCPFCSAKMGGKQ